MYVKQNLLYRWLTFDNTTIQSCINRYHPEKPALSYIKSLIWAVTLLKGRCCLLGLGGGGIAHALTPYQHDVSLWAVEHSLEVIEISKRYFMMDTLQNINIVHQDALQFLQTTPNSYQHILVDLFNANDFPAHCRSEDFFLQCLAKLETKGILGINIANSEEHRLIFNFIDKIFPLKTITVPVFGTRNLIILAYNGDSLSPLIDLIQKQNTIKQLTWDRKWGYVAHFK